MKRKNIFLILAIWILLYPIGNVFTIDKEAQATRTLIGVVPFQILSAIGLYYLLYFFYKKRHFYFPLFTITIIIFFSFAFYTKLYFVDYPLYSSDYWGWQYRPREIVAYFISVQEKYDNLYMNGEFNGAHIIIPFYLQVFGAECKKCTLGNLDKFDSEKRQLFALSPNKLKEYNYSKFEIKNQIYYPNNKVAFLIGEVK